MADHFQEATNDVLFYSLGQRKSTPVQSSGETVLCSKRGVLQLYGILEC